MKSKSFDNVIVDLKTRVNEMLIERSELADIQKTVLPSPIWEDAVSVFKYLMNLSSEDFKNIRFHTGLINGGSFEYWHPYPEPDPETVSRKLGYVRSIQDIPEKYWIGEPPAPGIPRPMGVDYRGHIVNSNIVRFQQCISNLYRVGALESIIGAKQKQIIIEVGGGYGALAHHIGGILGKNATCILIDLPEMLLFQGAYLAVNNPEKSIYIYDRETFTPDFVLDGMYDYDYVLIPNFALNKLNPLTEVALFINLQSFQEMTERQVREYLKFGAERITQYLYSDNLDTHPYNKDLTSLSKILEEYYCFYPSAEYYEELFKDTDFNWAVYYKKYLGIPKSLERKFPEGFQMVNSFQNVKFKNNRHKKIIKKMIPKSLRKVIRSYAGIE